MRTLPAHTLSLGWHKEDWHGLCTGCCANLWNIPYFLSEKRRFIPLLCVCVWACIPTSECPGRPEECVGSLEVELQVVVSYPTCVLGKLQSPVKAASTLTTKSPLQTHSSQQLIGTYSIILPVKTNALIGLVIKPAQNSFSKSLKEAWGPAR